MKICMDNRSKHLQTRFYFIRTCLWLSLLFILSGCEIKARRFEGELYPPLTDAVKGLEYQVSLNGNSVFVEKLSRFDVPVYTAKAAFDEQQKVKIDISVNQQIMSYSISPLREKIPATVKGNTLSFALDKPEYLVVKINELDYLFLLLDAPIKDKPQESDQKVINISDYQIDNTGENDVTKQLQAAIDKASMNAAILYFPKGTYKTGQLNVKSNVTLFLESGTQIKATIDATAFPGNTLLKLNGDHIKIFGHGTIDGSGAELRRNGTTGIYLLQIANANNIEIDGPVLRNSCFWNTRVYQSTGVHLKNIKVINNRPVENWNNTDGVDFDSSIDCSLENALLYCGDDNMVVKGLDDKRQYNTENIRFEKIITLSNSAAAKIGTETCVRLFNQIIFKDIDVVLCKRAMVIDAFDSATVKNVVFENMTIEAFDYSGSEPPCLMDFEITDNSWRPSTGNSSIEDITVRNVDVLCDMQQVKTRILGRTPQYSIHNLLIDGLRVKGKSVETWNDINLITNNNASGLMLFDLKVKGDN